MSLGKRVRIFDKEGANHVSALLVPVGGRTLVVEGHPNDYGRILPLNGRSRIYFLGRDLKVEEIDTFEVSKNLEESAHNYVRAVVAFEAAASPLGILGRI